MPSPDDLHQYIQKHAALIRYITLITSIISAVVAFFYALFASFPFLYAFAFGAFIWAVAFFGVKFLIYYQIDSMLKIRRSYLEGRRLSGSIDKSDPAASIHGSATYASYERLLAAGHIEPDPIKGQLLPMFGEFVQPGRRKVIPVEFPMLCYAGQGHILTIAPSRSGKGATQIIPNLLLWPGPALVTDIKGENYDITQRKRRKFGPVYALAPFRDTTNHLNPLDELDHTSPAGWEVAALMAEMLITSTGSSDSIFWEHEARSLVAAVIMYVACEETGERRTLGQVREYLTLSGDTWEEFVLGMAAHEKPQIRRTASAWMQKSESVQGGIHATINSQMGIWDSDGVINLTSRSDFRFGDLKSIGQGTVYLIIPPDQIDRMRPFVRLLVALALRAMTLIRNRDEQLPVTFFLDEFTAMGRMPPISQGLLYAAGYSVRLWMFAQDFNSLENVYGKNAVESFIANSGARLFFGINSFDTAKMISEMAGRMTVLDGNLEKPGVIGRSLITPDEVMKMPKDIGLVFIEGHPPAAVQLWPYYKIPTFDGVYDKWRN